MIGWADRTSHDVVGYQQAGRLHTDKGLFERSSGDDNGRYTGFFYQPGKVSHGHVTNRSYGYEEGYIDLMLD